MIGLLKTALIVFFSLGCELTFSQSTESSKSCDFKEVGLHFESRLIRNQKILVGYEVKIKNVGEKSLIGFEHPVLPKEAAYSNIYEIPPDRSRRTSVNTPLRIYPMHVPPEKQQKRFIGPLHAGEEKTFFVKMEEVFRDGYIGRPDHFYDLRIGIDFVVRPPDISYTEIASRYGAVQAEIAFGGCLSYASVRLTEPSGK